MTQPVKVRRLTDHEGHNLRRIVRRGTMSTVRYRRAMILLASAGGNTVPVIARLVQADEDTVRDVIHRFNEIRLACLDPQWAAGRPRLLSPDDEDFVARAASGGRVENLQVQVGSATLRRIPRPKGSRDEPLHKTCQEG